MTDIVEQSKQAREKLASALSILQSPDAGSLIDSVAEPVARAMGALHQIESSGGENAAEKGALARDSVREALAILQGQPESPIGDQAMEHIAGSLGMVHQLAESTPVDAKPAEEKPAEAKPAEAKPAEAEVKASEPKVEEKAPEPQAPASNGGLDKTQIASDPAPAAPSGGLDATLPTPTRPEDLDAKPAVQLDSTQASAPSPFSASKEEEKKPEEKKAEEKRQESAPAPKEAEPSSSRPRRNSKVASAPSVGRPEGALEVEANLGAHSPTNFYKGLSGNDVVDDGGLFVATYDIPDLGKTLWIQVHMPGGYEFEALAEVRWTRESGAGDAPPGFGCAFKSVSKEARQLIYRYVRNREPLFHDDL